MPDRDEQHSPYFQNKDVYERFICEFRSIDAEDPPISLYFFRFRKPSCRHIKVNMTGGFGRCYVCEELGRGLKEVVDHCKLSSVPRTRNSAHVSMVMEEQLQNRENQDKAIVYPENFSLIIIDRADQSLFGLPHFLIKAKDVRGKEIKIILIRLLENQQPSSLHLSTMTANREMGAHHNVEAIHRFVENLSH